MKITSILNAATGNARWALCAILAVCILAGGCDIRPAPITEKWKTITSAAVDPNDADEVKAVTAAEVARVQYRYRVTVLREYCNRIGDADRFNWSGKEIENIDEAQWFQWTGIPEVLPPEGESLTNADSQLLVEHILTARAAYNQAMRDLEQFYQTRNNAQKQGLVSRVRQRFDPVRTYIYFFSAEAPPENMKPDDVIPAAEQLYEQAMTLYNKGKPLPLLTDYSKQREALRLFLTIIEKHPTSTRSPLAAFYIGHIYREYFNEDVRAVMWYQRAWQWDPSIQVGARFQAAVVYDYRLQNKDKAMELYKLVLEFEFEDLTNRWYARRRIKELNELKLKQQRR